MAVQGESLSIDDTMLERWSAPFRGWHYWPGFVIPPRPESAATAGIVATDVPTVYQIPGDPKWYMSFVGFDGAGYRSFVAESDDLLNWSNYRLAIGYGSEGDFDFGGRVIGGFLFDSYELRAPRRLRRRDGKFWMAYLGFPRKGGYELRPGNHGIAVSEDGLSWERNHPEPILSVLDSGCEEWERSCLYLPWLLERNDVFLNFYNAARNEREQTGFAWSGDLIDWTRNPSNPILRNRPDGFDSVFCSDPRVFRAGDHWVMFYFGLNGQGAHIMVAFSFDLVNWVADPEPLYRAGGNPSGLDAKHAHKVSLVYNPANDTFYMHYCAVPASSPDGIVGRGIGLITSRPVV